MACAAATLPILPLWTNSRVWRIPGMLRLWTPIWHIRPSLRAHCVMTRPSRTLWQHGFSTYTSLPAWHAQIVASACQWLGVAIEMASIDLSSSTFRRSVKPAGRFLVSFSVSFNRCSSTDSSTSQMAATSTLGILA